MKMLRTMLKVDDCSPRAFPFLVWPKVGDMVGVRREDGPTHATITGLRRERGPDGRSLILVSARTL
jgi:hypothetical protein